MIARALTLARCYADVVSFDAHDANSIVDFCFDHPIRPLQVRSEFLTLAEKVAQLQPKTVLEIGTAAGGSLFLFCCCSAPHATVISVDLPHGKHGGGYHWAKIPLYRKFARREQQLHLIRGDSHSSAVFDRVRSILRERKLDLLFIDGDHTYEGVKGDFERFSPLVRKGGMVVFHDIVEHPPETECAVDRFWNEVKTQFSHQEIIESPSQGWAGIGLLYL